MSLANYRFVGAGTRATVTNTKASRASKMGRLCPIDRTSGTKLIIPFAIPWALSSDQYGISYPANTVGVIGSIGLSGAGPSFTAKMDDYISNHTIPVPGILDLSKYSARFVRDLSSLDLQHTMAQVGSFAAFYRDANGYQPYPVPSIGYWEPQDSSAGGGGIAATSATVGYNGTSTIGSGDISANSIGCRNMRFAFWLSANISPLSPHVSGTYDIEISHNPDGSLPAVFVSGSVVDYTRTFNATDFSTVSTFSPYKWITPEWDTGPIYPTTGIATLYRIIVRPSITLDAIALAAGVTGLPGHFDHKISPQIIPFRYSCTGDGSLIAPGGLPL